VLKSGAIEMIGDDYDISVDINVSIANSLASVHSVAHGFHGLNIKSLASAFIAPRVAPHATASSYIHYKFGATGTSNSDNSASLADSTEAGIKFVLD
jgi:hypothetical protein